MLCANTPLVFHDRAHAASARADAAVRFVWESQRWIIGCNTIRATESGAAVERTASSRARRRERCRR